MDFDTRMDNRAVDEVEFILPGASNAKDVELPQFDDDGYLDIDTDFVEPPCDFLVKSIEPLKTKDGLDFPASASELVIGNDSGLLDVDGRLYVFNSDPKKIAAEEIMEQKGESFAQATIGMALEDGEFGPVLLAQYAHSDLDEQIHSINMSFSTKTQANAVWNTLHCLSHLVFPNIVEVRDIFRTQSFLHCVVPSSYSLRDILEQVKTSEFAPSFDSNYLQKVASDILMGIQYLQSQDHPIYLTNLSPKQCLMRDGRVQINVVDTLGNIEKSNHFVPNISGRKQDELYYMAPEVLDQRSITDVTAIWSFGVIMYEMFKLKLPFSTETCQTAEEICSAGMAMEELFPNSKGLCKVLQNSLRGPPELRKSALSLLQSDAFSVDPDAIPMPKKKKLHSVVFDVHVQGRKRLGGSRTLKPLQVQISDGELLMISKEGTTVLHFPVNEVKVEDDVLDKRILRVTHGNEFRQLVFENVVHRRCFVNLHTEAVNHSVGLKDETIKGSIFSCFTLKEEKTLLVDRAQAFCTGSDMQLTIYNCFLHNFALEISSLLSNFTGQKDEILEPQEREMVRFYSALMEKAKQILSEPPTVTGANRKLCALVSMVALICEQGTAVNPVVVKFISLALQLSSSYSLPLWKKSDGVLDCEITGEAKFSGPVRIKCNYSHLRIYSAKYGRLIADIDLKHMKPVHIDTDYRHIQLAGQNFVVRNSTTGITKRFKGDGTICLRNTKYDAPKDFEKLHTRLRALSLTVSTGAIPESLPYQVSVTCNDDPGAGTMFSIYAQKQTARNNPGSDDRLGENMLHDDEVSLEINADLRTIIKMDKLAQQAGSGRPCVPLTGFFSRRFRSSPIRQAKNLEQYFQHQLNNSICLATWMKGGYCRMNSHNILQSGLPPYAVFTDLDEAQRSVIKGFDIVTEIFKEAFERSNLIAKSMTDLQEGALAE